METEASSAVEQLARDTFNRLKRVFSCKKGKTFFIHILVGTCLKNPLRCGIFQPNHFFTAFPTRTNHFFNNGFELRIFGRHFFLILLSRSGYLHSSARPSMRHFISGFEVVYM